MCCTPTRKRYRCPLHRRHRSCTQRWKVYCRHCRHHHLPRICPQNGMRRDQCPFCHRHRSRTQEWRRPRGQQHHRPRRNRACANVPSRNFAPRCSSSPWMALGARRDVPNGAHPTTTTSSSTTKVVWATTTTTSTPHSPRHLDPHHPQHQHPHRRHQHLRSLPATCASADDSTSTSETWAGTTG